MDWKTLHHTLEAACDEPDERTAEEAVHAAELVAATAGEPPDDLGPEDREWAETHGIPPDELVELACRSMKCVAALSEDWHDRLNDLRYRLGDVAAACRSPERRRTFQRMKRLAIALLLLALTGCGSSMNLAGTSLTLTAVNPIVGQAVFHLDCAPAGGDVSDPSTACAALARDPKLVTSPRPFTCIGGTASWFDMTISGRLAGKPVQRKFSTCWTAQMATLEELGLAHSLVRHVLRRRHGVVQPGIPRTFPAGTLRPGDLLVCRISHHGLQLGIPDTHGPIGSVGAGAVAVTLTGTRHADGSVTASCRRGSS